MNTKTETVLSVHHLCHSYSDSNEGAQWILKDISFSLNKGQSLGIIGPNGGGKSTLLNILAGSKKATQGEMFLYNKPVDLKKGLPKDSFSYVPQSTTLEDLLPIRVSDFVHFGRHGLSPEALKNCRSEEEVMKLTGIWDRRTFYLKNLSGGEKQRTLLAKALIKNPPFLLLDEPTTGLDSTGQDQLISILSDIQKNLQTTLIIVDHNIGHMLQFCHQILCLNRTHHWHDKKELLTQKVLSSIYHCEFEHLLIHEKEDQTHLGPHQHCSHEDGHHHQHKKEKLDE